MAARKVYKVTNGLYIPLAWSSALQAVAQPSWLVELFWQQVWPFLLHTVS